MQILQEAQSLLQPHVCREPPNGGVRGWAVLAASFIIYVICVGYQYTTGVYYKAWVQSDEFKGVLPSTLAWANSLEAAGFLCGSVFGSWIVSRSSPRMSALTGAGCILMGALMATLFGGSSPIGLFALLLGFGVLMGIGNAMTSLAAVVSIQQYFSSRRGRATGVTVAGSGCGAFILGPVLETLTGAWGWRVSLLAYGGMSAVVCTACAAVLVPLVLVATPGQPSDGSPAMHSSASHKNSKRPIISASRRRLASLGAEADIDDRALEPADIRATRALESHDETVAVLSAAAIPKDDAGDASSSEVAEPDTSLAASNGSDFSGAASTSLAPPLPSYADLLESPSFITFCCTLSASAILWFIVPTASASRHFLLAFLTLAIITFHHSCRPSISVYARIHCRRHGR
jgi:MFS family permease